MPTIEDHPPLHRRVTTPTRRARRRPPLSALLLAVLIALAAARTLGLIGPDGAHDQAAAPPQPPLTERAAGDTRLQVPAGWVTIERTDGHVTWGSADRTHTVTLATTESSAEPLPAVVGAIADDAGTLLDGTRLASDPRVLELDDRGAHDDVAMLVELQVERAGLTPLDVRQIWRRDARAGLDLVATWTSSDGTWPVSPRDAVPRTSGSG